MADWTIRRMTVEDAELIGQQREAMFRENGIGGDSLDAMRAAFVRWVWPRIEDGTYLGWAVEDDGGRVVAGAGLFVLDWPPHPQHPQDGRRAYVLNVYVGAEARGAGLAKRLMGIVEDEARGMGIEYAVLHASPMGRPVYEGLGWTGTNEMARSLVGRAGTPADSVR
jgi:GNAT superfamily N-acetyltransferase